MTKIGVFPTMSSTIAIGAPVLAIATLYVSMREPALGMVLLGGYVAALAGRAFGVGLMGAATALVLLYRGLQGLWQRSFGVPEVVPAMFDALTLLVFVVGCAYGFARGVRSVPWAAWAFLLLTALCVLNPRLPGLGYGFAGARALVLPLLFGVGVALWPFKSRERELLLAILVLIVGLNALIVLRQVVAGFSEAELAALTANLSTYDVAGFYRPLGALASNQDLGLLMGMAVPALLAGSLSTTRVRRLLLIGVLLLAASSVLSSLLRSAILAAAVGSVFVMLRRNRGRGLYVNLLRLLIGATAAASVASAALALGALGDRTEAVVARLGSFTELSSDRSYNARRDQTFPVALAAATDNPLGVGPGAAGPVSQAAPLRAPLGPLTPDNGYLLIAIQLGWLGVVAQVSLLLHLLRRGGNHAAAVGASGATAALATAMLLGGYWSLVGPALLFFCFAGLAGNLRNPGVDAE